MLRRASCQSAVFAAYQLCADRLTLCLICRVGRCDPCLQCGANFVATAFEGKAHSLRAVLTVQVRTLWLVSPQHP
jgi:hypothetical protein